MVVNGDSILPGQFFPNISPISTDESSHNKMPNKQTDRRLARNSQPRLIQPVILLNPLSSTHSPGHRHTLFGKFHHNMTI